MGKQQIESLIGDTGPIEEHLHAVATERQLPGQAITLCTLRFEEAAPTLRAALVRAADGERLSDDEEMLVFRGLYVLGGARDREACQPLLRLLRRPERELDRLLGDAITEDLQKIVAGVFDEDIDSLFGAICDRSTYEFIREALLGTATFLTWEGRIPYDRMQRLLEQFYEERLAADGDMAWVGWLEAIALLGMRNLAPLVHHAWSEGRVPTEVLEPRHFESDLSDAERAPDDVGRFKSARLGYIDDVLEALEWTRLTQDEAEGSDWEPHWTDLMASQIVPAVNPWRHVGRNDPCPCGSGKKAKNCCLGT